MPEEPFSATCPSPQAAAGRGGSSLDSTRAFLKRLGIGSLIALALGVASSARQNIPPDVIVPSANFPTIQSGIDGVPNGGTVSIAPGEYRENLLVQGKQVTLAGSDPADLPEIRAVDRRSSVVTFSSGGGGNLRNLKLQGGDHGIAAVDPQATAVVQAENVFIRQSGSGVFGRYASLRFINGESSHNSRNGFTLLEAGSLLLDRVEVSHNDCGGILILNNKSSLEPIVLDRLEVTNNECGGIEIRGGARPVEVRDCFAKLNRVFGIHLVGVVNAAIKNSTISFTKAVAGKWGDGLRVERSLFVDLERSLFSFNARAGLLALGCSDGRETSCLLLDNTFLKNAFDIDIEKLEGCTGANAVTLADSGGNLCDSEDCHAVSGSIDPTPTSTLPTT